jgi:hypothetical protein
MSLADLDYSTRPAASEPNRTKRPTPAATRRTGRSGDTHFTQPVAAVSHSDRPLHCVWQVFDNRLQAVWVR